MTERIIALRGRGGIGKSTTIILLANQLVNRGWILESRFLHGNGIDITDVYTNKDGKRLGVASAGDNFREVDSALSILFNANCSVVICACRTRGATHTAIRQFTNNINLLARQSLFKTTRLRETLELKVGENILN